MDESRTYGKVIAAGHICLDITPVFPGKTFKNVGDILAPGKMLHLDGVNVHSGGSAANTGLALRILGNDVLLLGKVGCDRFGEVIRQEVASYGVEGLIQEKSGETSFSMVLAIPGIDRIILHSPGANDTYAYEDIPEIALEEARLFHFGYPPLMKKMFEADGEELRMIFARVKAKGIATSLDMCAVDPNAENGRVDWRALLQKVLPYVDIFVPSFEEILFMTDREKYDRMTADGADIISSVNMERDVVPIAEELLSMGAKIVLIKCGTAGMYYCTADAEKLESVGSRLELDPGVWGSKKGMQAIFPVEQVKSATGAGDSSIAAFLTGILKGKAPAYCARLAAAEGACCVTEYDALSGLKNWKELVKMAGPDHSSPNSMLSI